MKRKIKDKKKTIDKILLGIFNKIMKNIFM